MNLTIKTTNNMEITDAIRDYIHKRLEGLDKFASTPESELLVNVEVGKISNHHKSGDIFRAEVNMVVNGKSVYVVSEKEDLYAAVDDVKDRTIEEVKKLKDKHRSAVREGGQKVKDFIKRTFFNK